MMDRMTFADPEVIKYVNKNFYPVKLNAESGDPIKFKGSEFVNLRFDPNRSPRARNGQHQLAQFFKVSGYPTVVFLDEKLDLMDANARGLHPKDKFLEVINRL
jgi:thioredoxin-related protein